MLVSVLQRKTNKECKREQIKKLYDQFKQFTFPKNKEIQSKMPPVDLCNP